LRLEGAAWCAGRQLAFDRGEEARDQDAPAREVRWKLLTPLSPSPLNPPRCTAPFGRDDALGLQGLAHRLLVALTRELGIRQHQPDRDPLVGGVDTWAPRGTVMGRAAARRLGDHDAPIHSDGHGPLQPGAPREAFTPLLGSLHEAGADGPWREARRIHRHGRLVTGLSYQPLNDGMHGLLECCLSKSAETAVARGVIGHMPQPQGHAQLCVFGQPDFGLTKGPVFIAHQAEDGAPLRLGKPALRECTAVGRPRGLAHVQRHGGKFHSPNVGPCAHLPPKTCAR
jgi:hypothetical protein